MLIKLNEMSRYNSQTSVESALLHSNVLDFSSPRVAEFEEDLLGHFLKGHQSFEAPEFEDHFFVDQNTILEKFSLLSSRGSTSLSSESSETSSCTGGSEADLSHKLTEATRDTTSPSPAYELPAPSRMPEITREIFLISKLKKREPRRSFDLGELTSGQEIVFERNEPKVVQTSHSMCVDKEKVSVLYNKMVDDGCCFPEMIRKLNNTETQILEIMLRLRLILTKTIKENNNSPLLANPDELNMLLSKSSYLKKRSEELLKKNFKTVLKTLLEKERKLLPKGTSALESRNLFTNKYFGGKAREYDKIFKCIQMSQDYYSNIFKFTEFKNAFAKALSTFMEQFLVDRVSKTENLISQIKSDLISGTSVKSNLRTPWSVKEAEASMKLMSQFL